MKRIKQVNDSKDRILNALFTLLIMKKLDDITMTEIANEADVVRMTLYRHFKAKEDIVLYGFEVGMQEIPKAIQEKTNPILIDLLEFRFRLLKEFPYTSLLANHHYLDKLFQTIGIKYVEHFHQIIPELEDEYMRSFIGGGIDAITKRWIASGMEETPESIASKVNEYILKLTKV